LKYPDTEEWVILGWMLKQRNRYIHFDWIHLAQKIDQWRALLQTKMKPYMNGEDVFGSPYLASEGLLYVIS